jgi:uncharacterized protein (UPF0332 family)
MFDWADYLTLAQELATRSSDEAALRSAISRAYYAAFCEARNTLRQDGVNTDNLRSHWSLWAKYRDDPDPIRQIIGEDGNRVRGYRTQADYLDEFPDLSVAAQDTIFVVERMLESLGDLHS